MHPARSVIAFTTLSGAGFGLLFWIGMGLLTPTGWVAFVFLLIAYLLAAGGLSLSALHLGHPERALLAFREWRTSWLSREAWASCAALALMALYGLGLVFFGSAWRPLGWLGGLASLGTVVTTSMIYRSIRAVPRWAHWTTPVLYLGWALAGGALLSGRVWLAVPLLLIAAAAQAAHWVFGDRRLAESGTTLGTATGLGERGAVRSFEAPHTGNNYLLREMGWQVARRHALKLRGLCLLLGAAVPILLLLLPWPHLMALPAVLSHLAGVAAGRWLFFAEAEHVMGLYYGLHGSHGQGVAPGAPAR